MATVTLDRLWVLNRVTGELVSALTDPSRDQSWSVAGAIRTYAGGRQRGISTAGLAGQWSMTLVECNLTTFQQFRNWMGQGVTVLLRDHRGQSMNATFFGVDAEEIIGSGATAVYKLKINFLRVDVVAGI